MHARLSSRAHAPTNAATNHRPPTSHPPCNARARTHVPNGCMVTQALAHLVKAYSGNECDGMGGGHDNAVSHAKQSSLATLPGHNRFTSRLCHHHVSQLDRQLHARSCSAELHRILWRRSEAMNVVARAGGMLAPSPLQSRACSSLFLSHGSAVPTALPRAPPSPHRQGSRWSLRGSAQPSCTVSCGGVARQ